MARGRKREKAFYTIKLWKCNSESAVSYGGKDFRVSRCTCN